MKRCVAILLLAVMIVWAVPVSAAEPLEFSVSFGEVAGAEFDLYQVATVQEGEYVLTQAFQKLPVELSDPDSAAATLAGFVLAEGIEPMASAVTDSEGTASFGQVEQGMYLLLGEMVQQGDAWLTPMPALLTLTESCTAEVKYERTDGQEALGVLKQWVGEDAQRPAQVTVTLYCDGVALDTVELCGENAWQHIWTELEAGHSYQVVEENVPDNYTVHIAASGGWFTVTNTYVPPTVPTPPSGDDLPQTGQLWWPVPLLAGLGLLCFAAGWVMVNGKRHEK